MISTSWLTQFLIELHNPSVPWPFQGPNPELKEESPCSCTCGNSNNFFFFTTKIGWMSCLLSDCWASIGASANAMHRVSLKLMNRQIFLLLTALMNHRYHECYALRRTSRIRISWHPFGYIYLTFIVKHFCMSVSDLLKRAQWGWLKHHTKMTGMFKFC